MSIRSIQILRQENADFRDALADIAHGWASRVSVERLQAIAAAALEKHAYRKGLGAPGTAAGPCDGQMRLIP